MISSSQVADFCYNIFVKIIVLEVFHFGNACRPAAVLLP
uniref:Uncharacterized protein n=1 Tax=Arundo donax TaxID=35708 RepID=A0A0A9HC65_ARUDO